VHTSIHQNATQICELYKNRVGHCTVSELYLIITILRDFVPFLSSAAQLSFHSNILLFSFSVEAVGVKTIITVLKKQ
jgi:hypothetical protein